MAKACDDAHLDAFLDSVALSNVMHACSSQPANHAAIAAASLADVAMTAGDGNDYTHANGDTNGRKTTVAQKTGVTIDNTGTANHVALTNGTIIYVTTCTAQALTAGGTVTFPTWDIEIADPA